MRKLPFYVASLALGAIVFACTSEDENPPLGGDGLDGSTTSDGGGNSDALTSIPVDANFSQFDAADARSDARSDARADARADADAADADAADAADADADVDAEPISNFARLGTAVASSEYSTGYAASRVNDGDLATSWYSATGSCPDNGGNFECAATQVTITLDALRTIGRVKIFGNRDAYPDGYDVLTAKIELLDDTSAVIYTADVTTSRGTEPNGDVDHVVSPAKTGVKAVRVVVLTGQTTGPGVGEIEAYAD
jgi:hypothetical protein